MKLIRKNNKKGFTLVELIVVIAIIAILALILIPSITGYIDRADKQRVDASARALYSQAVLLETDGASNIKDTLQAEADKAGKADVVSIGKDAKGNMTVTVTSKNNKSSATYPKAEVSPGT